VESHFPAESFTFRNLSRSPHNRLRDADPAPAAADSGWLAPLLAEARAVEPSLVVLSYGTAAAHRGPEALPAFTNVYHRLLDGILSLNTSAPPRLVILSPLSFDPPEGATYAEVTNRIAAMLPFAEAAWAAATNRNAEFVDLFGLSRGEVFASLRAAESGNPRPRLTKDGVRPTPFGARRLSFAIDPGLRWPGNNWRFGLMADGSWRDGGFGARIRNHTRADDYVRVIFTEERLPTPNPLVEVNLEKESQPLCYIQVRGLKPGQYELRVDGRAILTGTHADWHRYEIICRGPSWDQAEELRQTIMKKNRAWEAWWVRQRDRTADQREAPDPQIAELEARIARSKKPVERTYEIVRTGDAPAGTPDTSATAAP
jgi:lysophospholipase L1-like esterase